MARTGRKVVRTSGAKGLKGSWQRFKTSFTPRGFKAYWFSRAGAIRVAKLAAVGFIALLLVFIYFAKDLPSPSKINAKIGAANSVFWDRTHTTKLYEIHGDKNRSIIEFKDMPDTIKHATIAIEDKDFYKHGALSPQGIGRATVGLLNRNANAGGGSTITQQYVKNALLTPERSYQRKIKELILSFEIEQLYKKDDILKLYLNEISYGGQAYGIQAAAKTYFGKDAKNLTLEEASLLAAIPQLPSYYSPYGTHTDALIARQHVVLDNMAEQGYITKERADQAKKYDVLAELPPYPNTFANVTAPHFVLYAQEYLENKYGTRAVTDGGLDVTTTLDLPRQNEAQEAIAKNMASVRRAGGSNAALVSADPKNGQVLAMVGSYQFSDPKFGAFNVALADRQPGSSFKPIVYATAMKGNWGAGSTIYDVPTDFGGGYKPTNYDLRNYGVQSIRTALDGSLNIPAVKMLYIAGVPNSIKTAKDMGISTLTESPSTYGLSLVLGSGEVKLNEMVNAYESFANGGMHYPATPILKVTDPTKKTVLDNTKKPTGKRALDPQIAYIMSNILSDNGARAYIFGSNSPLNIPGRKVAAKTGTTTSFRDAWTMGYSPDIVTGVWVGNNDNTVMKTEAVDIAAPIWNSYMTSALKAYPTSSDFTKPTGIQTITLDANTGKLPSPTTKATRTDIFPSWYKPENVTGTKTANVDKVSGKLATSCTPAAAVESRSSSGIAAEIPSSDTAYARWAAPVAALAARLGYSAGGSLPTENDDVHDCNDAKPTVNVTATPNGNSYTIKVTASQGRYPITGITVSFDDQVISNGSTGSYSFSYTPTTNGSHTITAQAVDTALYTGSDSTTVNVTNAGGSGIQTISPGPSAGYSAAGINFAWQSIGSTYQLFVNNALAASPGSSNSANVILAPGSYTWEVKAANGQTSGPKTLTVQ